MSREVRAVKRTILALSIVLLAMPALAKVKTMDKIDKLPEKQDEAELWERATGHEERLRNLGTLKPHPAIEEYLDSLAERMLGDFLDHLDVELRFVVVEEPTLNAWAYPYGTIGIHTGLLVRMDNEAQLAAIVSHEISHFLQRHTYREMLSRGRQGLFGKGLGFLASAALARETGTFDPNVGNFAGDLWYNLSTSGYSQKNEYVADEEGLMLMARAGLSRDESIAAFEKLAENEVYGAGDPRQMWSSHPRLEDRIKNLQKEIKRAKRGKDYVAGEVPPAIDYYRAIAPAYLVTAKLDFDQGQFERAREGLERYVQARPDDPEGYFLMGEAYRRENPKGPDFSKALASYETAVDRDWRYADAHKEIGMAYRLLGKNAEALEAFERYLRLAPNAPDAGIVRGYLEELR